MKIKYLAHAAFKITSDSGTSIITDPYTVGDKLKYGEIKDSADIVTISHDHSDHNFSGIKGNPKVVKDAATVEIKGIKIKGIPVFHDNEQGRSRGRNTIFCFDIDGMRVCHLGDLGHLLDDAQVKEMGKLDVLLTPVGGFYTIDASAATRLADKLSARVTIPMHFKTPRLDYTIATVEDFLKGKSNVRRLEGSEKEIKKDKLPASPEILVLKPAML